MSENNCVKVTISWMALATGYLLTPSTVGRVAQPRRLAKPIIYIMDSHNIVISL